MTARASSSAAAASRPDSRPVIGITVGDPGGVGPEIIEAALAHPRLPRSFRYRVLGREAARGIAPGRSTRATGEIAYAALREAAELLRTGEIAAVATAPIQKESMAQAGFAWPGHTEFFAAQCGLPEDDAVMVLTDRRLTVALVSIHVSVRRAVDLVTPQRMIRTTLETVRYLAATRPPGRSAQGKAIRIAVAGLNPHASEHGLFGDEEARIIGPTTQALARIGAGRPVAEDWAHVPPRLLSDRNTLPRFEISGPHSPDTVFHRAVHGEFDAVICQYHDQGLIPFKLLAFSTGVNVTLGLPVIRTSPDHGTALDLAGTGRADSTSMFRAIELACRMVKAGYRRPGAMA
ncbi:4-hydroxythreonine-4-phosphate dehydrogenase PdxA [Verrucomicrobia bacterium LW23]|nr:4-hydroxythreonine-4-phosphate dehydrogenase PdxA [Verrucomicrobia bacterium LW23]